MRFQLSSSQRVCRLLCILVTAGMVPASGMAGSTENAQPVEEIRIAEALSASFRNAIEIARPSIVTVRAVERRPKSGEDSEAYRTGDATGLIVDRTGGILTSLHAVAEAEVVVIALADGREFPARQILGDAWSDLALVRISGAGDLSAAKLGNSDRVEVGDWVIAAGNSFGLGFSANPGTVSAKQRELTGQNLLLLQTNAPTNPGNSGGPLLNLRGEVIGVCEGGYSVQGGFDGVSFAIPIDVAHFVARELQTNHFVRWPYLGARFDTLSPDVAHELGCSPQQSGAVVTRVIEKSPASLAGLHVGDVVTSFRDARIQNSAALISEIQRSSSGDLIDLTFQRGGQSKTCQIRMEAQRASGEDQSIDLEREANTIETYDDPELGVSVSDFSATKTATKNLPPDIRGVLITRVASRSAARYLGVHPGTVITHVGEDPVHTLAEFRERMAQRPRGDGAVVLIWCAECGAHFFALRPDFANPLRPTSRQEGRAEMKAVTHRPH